MAQNETQTVDVMLVGAGIMSATLAVLLKELDPNIQLEIAELRETGAVESSNPWNNAGTGHAGLCELNYTPDSGDKIDISKALHINTQFEVSKQFWAYLTGQEGFGEPRNFINPVPHISFVRGESDIDFLKRRHAALIESHAFADMVISDERETLAEWMPLTMPGRAADEKVAATRYEKGTDVNFGAVTQQMLSHLSKKNGTLVTYNQQVTDLERDGDVWRVSIKHTKTGERRNVNARFVFLGAGGGALPLLQMSGIPESKGFGGFPVSGMWLRCDKPDVVEQHQAKVYSQAEVGAPPMSVPHLDTRVVDGQTSLLFGPFAGFSTKFLRHGSFMDLPLSIRMNNLKPMLSVARDNMDLTRYLIKEVMQSTDERLDALKKFYPQARREDWRLELAGQRVQIIKKDPKQGGILQFGTELVSSQDGSIAALLGASPGASVTVSVMLELLERCFKERYDSAEWTAKLAEIFPAREEALKTDGDLYRQVTAKTWSALKLDA
ncbi:malate dehydrogenase (quinone) [Atopomonas sediminilitoris]|uniref:malate dehydrogenase (quinone) n=1 Tax=Atopomonas sediminilitoris TaxID=2919919 RepID=UPI001F4EBDB5|nr:malate dehydrogenase (quinone) [Atopomonas sediminilitoris]MCJ8170005.1 malate dehydrogenase (quinone) [Atopomonas sediminilitoris]